MNVINNGSVSTYCDFLATGAREEAIRTWIKRNVRKHVLRTPGLHRHVSSDEVEAMCASGEIGDTPDWLPAAVRRGDALYLFDPESEAARSLSHDVMRIVDHRNAVPVEDMSRVSVEEATENATAWERSESRRRIADFARANRMDERTATALLARADAGVAALWPEQPGQTRSLLALDDGHELVQIVGRPGLHREGVLMDHCVETFWLRVQEGTARILSLRGPGNMPLATFEVGSPPEYESARLVNAFMPADLLVAKQIRGFRNGKPPASALSPLASAMAKAGIMANAADRRWIGLPSELDPLHHLKAGEMAMAMPGIATREIDAKGRLSPALLVAVNTLNSLLHKLDDVQVDALVRAVNPRRVPVSNRERVCETPKLDSVVWKVPNLLLTDNLQGLLRRRTDTAREPLVRLAWEILEAIKADPLSIHRVEPAIGTWRDALPFFAWCGLAKEWIETQERSRSGRRAWLDAERLRLKTLLRDERVGEAARAAAMNGINVQIPRLMARS